MKSNWWSGVIPEGEALKKQWLDTIQSELNRFQLTLPETGAYRSGAKTRLTYRTFGLCARRIAVCTAFISKYELVIQQYLRE